MMDSRFFEMLKILRSLELKRTLELMRHEKPQAGRLLEIGAGTGEQVKKLSDEGYSVEAIDMQESDYLEHRIWPVLDYDGEHIPFPDAAFDVVFSSNVLEHIPHVIEFQKEIHRVLKPNGIAVHLLPTGTCRFWTNITYYLFWTGLVFKRIFSRLFRIKAEKNQSPGENSANTVTKRLGIRAVLRRLIPPRHGEFGNTLTEIYYFSKIRWVKLFQRAGWEIKKYSTSKLFYSQHLIFGPAISLKTRTNLSFLLGSSCHVFIMTKSK